MSTHDSIPCKKKNRPGFVDLTGKLFGSLSVINRTENNSSGSAMWRCICICGEERIIAGTSLRNGRRKSCGCLSPKFKVTLSITGRPEIRTRTFNIWLGMHQRCKPSNHEKQMRNYYLKGIRVCERWSDFGLFLADMGEAPDGLSIDRINGCLGYEPGNCRWASSKQQANNTNKNRIIVFDGHTRTVSQWAEIIGVNPNTIVYRLRRGWPISRVLSAAPVPVSSLEKEKRTRPCPSCGTPFTPRTSQLKNGQTPCCSHKCAKKVHDDMALLRKMDELKAINETLRSVLI